MSTPLVSVLTPSLNQGHWLRDNLLSVQNQSYPHVEQVVMDGGSTDGTVDILRQAAGPRVTWRSEPDDGQSAALNKAFALSRGEFIGWLNSDDAYFGADVIADAVRVFEAHPSVAVVYGHALMIDSAGRALQAIWSPSFNARLLRLHDFIVQPAAFIRRSAVADTFVDESFDFTMDYELWLRLAARHRFRRLDQIVAVDRHHPARKAYMVARVGADLGRLKLRYGLPSGDRVAVVRKVWKIGARLAGVRLLWAALREPTAFEIGRNRGVALALRQVAVPRSRMG